MVTFQACVGRTFSAADCAEASSRRARPSSTLPDSARAWPRSPATRRKSGAKLPRRQISALRRFDSLLGFACPPEALGHVGRHLAEPLLVTQRDGHPLRFFERGEHPADLAQRDERAVKVKAQVHRLLAPRAALGKVLERRKSLVEAGRG